MSGSYLNLGPLEGPLVARHNISFLPPRHPVRLRPVQSSVLEAPLGLYFLLYPAAPCSRRRTDACGAAFSLELYRPFRISPDSSRYTSN